jgi:hypothetical protein
MSSLLRLRLRLALALALALTLHIHYHLVLLATLHNSSWALSNSRLRLGLLRCCLRFLLFCLGLSSFAFAFALPLSFIDKAGDSAQHFVPFGFSSTISTSDSKSPISLVTHIVFASGRCVWSHLYFLSWQPVQAEPEGATLQSLLSFRHFLQAFTKILSFCKPGPGDECM